MVKVEVVKPGFLTTIQDFGRPGEAATGMPWGGVMDRHSYALAHQILGNNPLDAVLEITMLGPSLRFLGNVNAVITGAEMSAQLNGKQIQNNKVYALQFGDELSFGKLKNGFRTYLAFDQQIDVPVVLGSKATYLPAKMGGFLGRALQRGDVFNLKDSVRFSQKEKQSTHLRPLELVTPLILKVSQGPEFARLTSSQKQTLFNTIYTLKNDSNRMGIRLDGTPIHGVEAGIISSGVVRGTVQLPPSGCPIILAADAPVTGGYLRVLNCMEHSMNQLAQVPIGDRVVFSLEN